MRKIIILIFLIISFFSVTAQNAGAGEGIIRLPKDTSKFGRELPIWSLVRWQDTAVSGYNNIYSITKKAIPSESIRSLINQHKVKLMGIISDTSAIIANLGAKLDTVNFNGTSIRFELGIDTLSGINTGDTVGHGILQTDITTRLKISDTSSMLLPYLRDADTLLMLSPYLRKSDTNQYIGLINTKLNISDTSLILLPYLRSVDTIQYYLIISQRWDSNYTKTYISTHSTNIDTTSLSNRINLKLNISDTSLMLVPYLRKSDTNQYISLINSKLKISDTSSMLLPYLRKADTIRYYPIIMQRWDSTTTKSYIATHSQILDTTYIYNAIGARVKYIDTTSMLSPYLRRADTNQYISLINSKLKITDTTAMLAPYLRTSNVIIPTLQQVTKSGATTTIPITINDTTTGGNSLYVTQIGNSSNCIYGSNSGTSSSAIYGNNTGNTGIGVNGISTGSNGGGVRGVTSGVSSIGVSASTSGNNSKGINISTSGSGSYPLYISQLNSDTTIFLTKNSVTTQITRGNGGIITPLLRTTDITNLGVRALTTKEYVDSVTTTIVAPTPTLAQVLAKGRTADTNMVLTTYANNNFGLSSYTSGINSSTIYGISTGNATHGFYSIAYGTSSEAGYFVNNGIDGNGIYSYCNGLRTIPLKLVSGTCDTLSEYIKNSILVQRTYGNGGIIAPNLRTTDITTLGSRAFTTKEYADSIVSPKLDSSIFYNQDTLLQEPTGFTNCDNINISYDSTTRKITVTGSFEAYWKGRKISELVNNWLSPAHSTVTNKTYYLYYNGSSFVFDSVLWGFNQLQIASVWYGVPNKIAYRETHGFMQWQVHEELHNTIGSYLVSGGDISGITLNSTTAVQRRPNINATVVQDEDLETTDTAFTSKSYTIRYLTGSGNTRTFTTNYAEMIPVLSANPYYNSYTGGAWGQTLFANNNYGAIFVIAVPVANSANSQKYRFEFIQPQQTSSTLATIQAVTSTSLNMGNVSSDEYVFIGKIIVRFTASDWQVIQIDKLTGTKVSQTSINGGYLSTVSVDATLSGNGTSSSPLGVVRSNWVDIASTPTRASKTTFTVTGDYTSLFTKGLIIKWTESSIVRCGMVDTSTYSAPNATITIIGDTIVAAGFDASSVKYTYQSVEKVRFAIAGTISSVVVDATNAFYATELYRVMGADLQEGTVGVTNNTTIDLNKIGTTMFTVKPTLTTSPFSLRPFTADTYTSLGIGNKVTLDIDATQTTPSVDLYVQLYLIPTRILNLP